MNFVRKKLIKKGYTADIDLRIKEFNKSLKIASIVLLVSILGIFAFLYSPYIYNIQTTSTPYFKSISSIYEKDEVVVNLANLCNQFELEEDKVLCVNHFVDEFFYYDEHPKEFKTIRYPEEIINLGGCCRDWSVFYSSVFSLIGFEYEFIYEPNHIYVKVIGENEYLLDQLSLEFLE